MRTDQHEGLAQGAWRPEIHAALLDLINTHGSSSPKAIKNAIRVAMESIQSGINPRIVEEIAAFHARK